MCYLFLEYPKCSTCQKAKKWLDSQGFDYKERDIVLENPNEEELREWLQKSGNDVKKFFNTSGLLYKSMHLKDKLPNMTEEEKIQLLTTNGMLVKRPIIVGKNFVLTGFKEEEWKKTVH